MNTYANKISRNFNVGRRNCLVKVPTYRIVSYFNSGIGVDETACTFIKSIKCNIRPPIICMTFLVEFPPCRQNT